MKRLLIFAALMVVLALAARPRYSPLGHHENSGLSPNKTRVDACCPRSPIEFSMQGQCGHRYDPPPMSWSTLIVDMFAERVGISGERLLSFLSVLDSEFFEILLLKPEQMQDETLGLAKEYCAMMGKFWEQQSGHSPFAVFLPVPCNA